MSEGIIYREGDSVVVEVTSTSTYAGIRGVERIGKKGKGGWKYRKTFRDKKVYLPDEYDYAVRDQLYGKDVLVLAMNGYSSLNDEKCREYGVAPGAYEKACEVLLCAMVDAVRGSFPNIDVRFIHGASDMGVDRAISRTAHALRRPQLGFSCPQYMMYVNDGDGVPVHVSNTVDEYSRAFVRSGDILIAANGRLQAYRMDIAAVFEYDKMLIPVNVLRLISSTGGPPAKNAKGQIEDAVAHYEQRVHLIGKRCSAAAADPWRETIVELNETVIGICRRILHPDVGLEVRL